MRPARFADGSSAPHRPRRGATLDARPDLIESGHRPREARQVLRARDNPAKLETRSGRHVAAGDGRDGGDEAGPGHGRHGFRGVILAATVGIREVAHGKPELSLYLLPAAVDLDAEALRSDPGEDRVGARVRAHV